MLIQEKLITLIERALEHLGVPKGMVAVELTHPVDPKFGDYSTNVAMVLSKSLGASNKKPIELAEKVADEIRKEISGAKHGFIGEITTALPGFINIFLTKEFFVESVGEVLEKTAYYGKNNKLWNKKIIVEYTDPNPFKQFHIGHLMSNAVGESLSRIFEFHDAKVTRANYGGDVGLHVAKCMWGMLKHEGEIPLRANLNHQVKFIGDAYVAGANAYETDDQAKKEIQELNKVVYTQSDAKINELYSWGKKVSLDHFNEIYEKLGSKFDYFFLESQVADEGAQIVREGLKRGFFKESEGAVIFEGEKYGLHNRVFINSQGLPTYEAKELGLTKKKFEISSFDTSIVITANEQNDYFKVVLKAIEEMYPEVAHRTKHISHGLMRFASGKMSSRKGNVITGESLLTDIEELVHEKMKERDFDDNEKREVAEQVAVAAIKYSILKQSIGKDIIFDEEKSLSFEGDSGPYIQYTFVRAQSVIAKAMEQGINPHVKTSSTAILPLERMLYKFPEIVERAGKEFAPQYITTYLIQLAGEFNAYYAGTKIVDANDNESAYRVALTEAVAWVLKNGLYILGIRAPRKM